MKWFRSTEYYHSDAWRSSRKSGAGVTVQHAFHYIDLLQYLMAVDRGNERIAHLHDPSNPAVVRILRTVIDAAHAAGIWVGLCGELAGDIEYTPLLVGLGIDELSTSASLVPRIKKAIRSLDMEACREVVHHALAGESASEIYARTTGLARIRYPDLF